LIPPLSRDKIILLKKEENYLEKDILVRIGQANKDIIGDSEKWFCSFVD
jgi:hypothetical protein